MGIGSVRQDFCVCGSIVPVYVYASARKHGLLQASETFG
jgi:hypothetical protein